VSDSLENAKQVLGRFGPTIAAVAVLLVLAVAGLSRVGCVNVHTPPGFEGYVRSKPIAGAGKFVGTQRGPTSTGWVWRQEVVNIDMRPRTYSEANAILTAEQLKLSFVAHGRIRLRPGSVRQVVEQYGGANWYEANVRQQFSAAVREQVQALKSFEVKDRVDDISTHVMTKMGEVYKDTPIEFLSVDIGDIEYPEVVVQSVIRKFVTNQENERKEIELKIAQKQIDIGVAEATGTRDAQRIIRTTLDPMYLQFEALNAIEELAGSPNTTFVVAPYSAAGGAPIIMSMEK
jgi:hypothetical protein